MRKIYVLTDQEGYLIGRGFPRASEDEIEIEVEEDHGIFLPNLMPCYKLVEGELIFDEARAAEIQKRREEARNKPTVEERLTMLDFQQAEILMESVIKDIQLDEQSKKLSAAEEMNAMLLMDLSMKGVI
jgi:hypothetical protein